MPKEYQQGQLVSPVTGTPGVDRSAGVAAEQIAQGSDKMRAAQASQASNELAQAQQDFGHASRVFQSITEKNIYRQQQQQQLLLNEKIASAKYAASTTLNKLQNELKAKYEQDPAAGLNIAQNQIDNVIEGFVPKNAPSGVQAQFRKALYEKKAEFINGVSDWQYQQEKVNSNNRFQSVVANSLQSMQQAGTTNDFMDRRDDFVAYAKATALTPERLSKTEETLRVASLNFVQGIAINNPKDIENAIGAAGQFLTSEQVGQVREQATKTIKQKADQALAQVRLQNEFDENVLQGKLTSSVTGALQQANTANPSPNDVSLLRKAGHDVASMGNVFNAEMRSLEAQIKQQPKNEVLITQYASLVKQKKHVEAAATQLADKADAAAEKIRHRNEIEARRAETAVHRELIKGIAASIRLTQAELSEMRAKTDLELASVKEGDNIKKLEEYSRTTLEQARKAAADLDTAKATLLKNPNDKVAAQKVQALSGQLSTLSHASLSANNAMESLLNKQASTEKEQATERAKLFETAGVPLYTTLLNRAQSPFTLKTEKGRLKLEGVNLKDATDRLNQLESSLVDVSQAGLVTKAQLQTLQSTIADRKQKLNAWAQQEGWGAGWANLIGGDAYNKPISDLETKGLALPGTAQWKKTVSSYKSHLDAEHARIFASYPDPRKAMEFIEANQQQIVNYCFDQTLKGKQPGK